MQRIEELVGARRIHVVSVAWSFTMDQDQLCEASVEDRGNRRIGKKKFQEVTRSTPRGAEDHQDILVLTRCSHFRFSQHVICVHSHRGVPSLTVAAACEQTHKTQSVYRSHFNAPWSFRPSESVLGLSVESSFDPAWLCEPSCESLNAKRTFVVPLQERRSQ